MSKELRLYQSYFSNRKLRREIEKQATADFRPAIRARTLMILRDRLVAANNALTVKEMRRAAENKAAAAIGVQGEA